MSPWNTRIGAFEATPRASPADWTRNLEVLGEAAKNVPVDVRGLDEEIPWRRITGLRDVLAHACFGVDDGIVWSVEVPSLLPRLVALRARL